MVFEEKVMDILEVPNKYFIVHASSCDLNMDTGLAKILDNSYDLVEGIRRKEGINGYDVYAKYFGGCILYNKVYTLFVKENSYDSVSASVLKEAIENLKEEVEDEGVKYLAFPTICCGNMGMKWKDVKNIIKSTFYNTDVHILICHTDSNDLLHTKNDILDLIEEKVNEDMSDSEEKIEKLYNIIESFTDTYFGGLDF